VLKMSDKIGKLYGRAGAWETKSQQAAAAGNYDRAGVCRTKALQLVATAKRLEKARSSERKEIRSNGGG
jgi:hypothetical protein